MPINIVSLDVEVTQGDYYKVKFVNAIRNPISYHDVKILVNNEVYDVKTDDMGVASIKIDLPLGKYLITSYFSLFSNRHSAYFSM